VFAELANRFQLVIPNAAVLEDDASALAFLRTAIFHWDAVPLTAQFVYRVHSHWCGKGWKTPVVIVHGTFDIPDTDESEVSTSEDSEDCSSGSEDTDLDIG
jgi:hypothetical protein